MSNIVIQSLSIGQESASVFLIISVLFIIYRYQSLSMGQGQGLVVERLLSNAMKYGEWIFIQVNHAKAS